MVSSANLVSVTVPPSRPPLDTARLAGLVAGTGLRVEVVEEAASTNALVAARARDGAAEGLVVCAEHQRRGRGRLDRSWTTPARAALTVSVLLRPPAAVTPARWPWLPLLTGLAVARSLEQYGVPAALKWPNDVLIGGAKVCGILLERVETVGGAAAVLGPALGPAAVGPAAVVGIGLNVSQEAAELPVSTATSLRLAGYDVDRTALLGGLLLTLWDGYIGWRDGGVVAQRALRTSYTQGCVSAQRTPLRVELPAETVTGLGVGVSETGALRVEVAGRSRDFSAGDVVHVRPAG